MTGSGEGKVHFGLPVATQTIYESQLVGQTFYRQRKVQRENTVGIGERRLAATFAGRLESW